MCLIMAFLLEYNVLRAYLFLINYSFYSPLPISKEPPPFSFMSYTYILLDCIYKEKHGAFVFVGMVHFA